MIKSKNKVLCNFEYFMKHGGNGCKQSRECEEYERNKEKHEKNTIHKARTAAKISKRRGFRG